MAVQVVVMGVSGCGKSTLGRRLAQAFQTRFVEGDDLHSVDNVDRMRAGIPLQDEDRWPWLERIGEELACAGKQDSGVVVACSALKKSYRDLLRRTAGPGLRFIHLRGERAALKARMEARQDHYMPATLLDSQLATLEPTDGEDDVLALDFASPADRLQAKAAAFLRQSANSIITNASLPVPAGSARQ
ncbi:gluconokinase [Martelella mediterranea]|uniref:Gluconokinase n=1 Tax=Martelella mediterranea DSM 17316 TaxID=1122214 RepID=A0A1U9Z055_9HYPH|nr:gluconokinase [Martelella mediterranea]AQZ51077.1 Thermoresistant gluconokinase [Martelella mediterranea DSM 17316]